MGLSQNDRKGLGEIGRALPTKGTEGADSTWRASPYKEQIVQAFGVRVAAHEGSYFVARNATPGTGLAGHAAPTDITSVLKPYIYLQNTHTAAEDVRLELDFIQLQCTAAGTNGTDFLWAIELDQGETDRYTSGGTALTALKPNMALSGAGSTRIYAGAVVAPVASSSAKKICHGVSRTVINVVGDVYRWEFGKNGPLSSMVVGGTAVANIVHQVPPCILGPGCQFLLHLAQTAQSAASSYQISMGWYER